VAKLASRTKTHILSAAIQLFSVQGFGSTSIREIAERAKVNAALISYHFKNKQGILESIMIDYFERLLEQLNLKDPNPLQKSKHPFSGLMSAVQTLISFQCTYPQVTAIIQRELSVDSMLVREVTSTYILRIKAHFAHFIEQGMEAGVFYPDLDLDMQIIQILSSIFFPYFNSQIVREVLYVEPVSQKFQIKYIQFLEKMWKKQLVLTRSDGDS
jgi:AcrR family transcriptional regulator